jgi:hypothetical protein
MRPNLLLTSLALLLLAACDPDARGGDDDAPPSAIDAAVAPDAPVDPPCGEACANHCPGTTATYLTGVVLAPNGVDPVPGASVYVPLALQSFPPGIACELCGDIIANAAVVTHTAADGSFRLGPIPTAMVPVPGDTVDVVAQKGRFRRLAKVAIQSWCGDNAATDGTLTLPGRQEDAINTIPKIAVVSGMYDDMECVLTKLGIDADAIDMYAGEPLEVVPSGNDFLRDPAALARYNIVFINCGNAYELELFLDDQVRTNLANYVAAGGRLYVTDQSYTFVEEVPAWAGVIDFGPGASGGAPETMNAAEIGDDGITTEAQVHDATMAAWLRAVEARTGESLIDHAHDTVHIGGFVGGWAMQLAVAALDDAKVWISGTVSGVGLGGDLPLTTTFDIDQCGRVLYSSYHTLGRPILPPDFPDYCTSGALSPQERLLEYLVLHAADCIVVQ